ncbi:O-antigen ligase family protein [Erysipelothrix sp. HDW6B]|uniref:O-antigen ligase family protein n=1 Tax=Erysipelothrix sp. HDW6B TaxID=2714929 RepID=UPI0014087CA4|nr:O-antigen ligase family protein [Erysipelothrix sp. HDW6B]QIK85643.1 O-antigen ligase family protein [Erysipelothrix sp. HDW6B]
MMTDIMTIGKRLNQQFQENLLFLLIFVLFLPNYVMYPSLIALGVYVAYEWVKFKDISFKSFIWPLIAYLIVVAYVNNNVLGLLAAIFMLYIIAYVGAVKRRITPRNYMKMQYYIVWSSLFNFFFIFIQYRPQWFSDLATKVMAWFNVGHMPAWQLPPYGDGYYRAYSTFDNPNFYAFILLIVLLVCFNQIQFQLTFKNYKLLLFYAGAFLINTYALFLTGTRSILLGLAVGLVGVILVQRKWTQLKILVFIGCIVGIFIMNNPSIFPRFMEVADHSSIRFHIWDNAMDAIIKEPWWGHGLFSYALLFDNTHAHNIFIESLLSLGIVGTGILTLFIIERAVDVYNNAYYLDYPLAISLLVAFLVYGVFDIPIYYIQTILLFAVVFCIPNRNKF